MEPEISLPQSQVPATCPYPEPARSSYFSKFSIGMKVNEIRLRMAP